MVERGLVLFLFIFLGKLFVYRWAITYAIRSWLISEYFFFVYPTSGILFLTSVYWLMIEKDSLEEALYVRGCSWADMISIFGARNWTAIEIVGAWYGKGKTAAPKPNQKIPKEYRRSIFPIKDCRSHLARERESHKCPISAALTFQICYHGLFLWSFCPFTFVEWLKVRQHDKFSTVPAKRENVKNG